jgi:hypothetical protein
MPREPLVYCVLDTSIFMECKPIDQIDWPTHFNAKEVCLLVTSPVLDELDKHKEEHSRKGKRERAQRVIKDLATARKVSLPSGDHPVRDGVRLRFLDDPPMDQYPALDRTNPDARIIASALRFKSETNIVPHLLTADINLQLRAERRGLVASLLERPHSHFLPNERDDVERENEQLRRENDDLRRREVQTVAQFTQNHRPVSELQVVHVRLREPAPEDYARALWRALRLPQESLIALVHSLVAEDRTRAVLAAGSHIAAFTPEIEMAIVNTAAAFPAPPGSSWVIELYLRYYADYLRALYQQSLWRARSFEIGLSLLNRGTVVAERVVLEVQVPGPYHLRMKGIVPQVPAPPAVPHRQHDGRVAFQRQSSQEPQSPSVEPEPQLPRETMSPEELAMMTAENTRTAEGEHRWPAIPTHDATRATYEVRQLLQNVAEEVMPIVVVVPAQWEGTPFEVEARTHATHQPQATVSTLHVRVENTLYREPWFIPIH